jgi:hypothetical protein
MFEKEYTLYDVLLKILNIMTINELIIWISIIIFLAIVSFHMNITLFQLFLITIVVILILVMSQIKQNETNKLQDNTTLKETNNMSLLKFIDSISYFKLYNPSVYRDFIDQIKEYIKILKFADIHEKENYKLYSKKIINENIDFQKKNILETFSSFEHTLDDRITSVYKLRELNSTLDTLLTKNNLIF